MTKWITRAEFLWLTLGLVITVSSYEIINHWPRPHDLVMATGLDRAIPLIPAFVVPYVSFIPIVFGLVPWLLRKTPTLKLYVIALFASQMVMNVLYVMVPATLPRPTLTDSGFFSWLLRDVVWQLDEPVNTFPSNHVTFSVIAILALATANVDRRARVALQGWLGLVCVSTLFVHQHVVADLVAGIVLGVVAFYAARAFASHRANST